MQRPNLTFGDLATLLRDTPHPAAAVREQTHPLEVGAGPRQPVFDLGARPVSVQYTLDVGRQSFALDDRVVEFFVDAEPPSAITA